MPLFNIIADITTSEHFEVEADNHEAARTVAVAQLMRHGHDREDIQVSECDQIDETPTVDDPRRRHFITEDGTSATCVKCGHTWAAHALEGPIDTTCPVLG